MKKFMLLALLSAFVFSVNSYAGDPLEKAAKKQAKSMKKEGWYVAPGAKPLEMQLYKGMTMEEPEYYKSTNAATAGFQSAAKLQAEAAARRDIVAKIKTEIAGIIKTNEANRQITADEATSINQTLSKSEQLIGGTLHQTITAVEVYRKTPNGNVEASITMCYPASAAKQAAQEVIREELLKESEDLATSFDKAMK